MTKGIAAMIDSLGSMRSRSIDDSLFDGRVIVLLPGSEIAVSLSLGYQPVRSSSMLVGVVGLKNNLLVVIEP
jgi:hypothetical protein